MNARQVSILLDHIQQNDQIHHFVNHRQQPIIRNNRPEDEEVMSFLTGMVVIGAFVVFFTFQIVISYAVKMNKYEL